MDPGDSAAWMAAIVAIAAAFISFVMMGIAVWQAVLARRQASSAWEQSLSARRSADVAEEALVVSKQAAAAAERQAAEALRQNEITEQQGQLDRKEREVDRRRHQKEQSAKYVATVHGILLAADAVREELRDHAAAVIESQERPVDRFGFATGVSLFVFGNADVQWDAAVNKVRVDKPQAPEVNAAIDAYNNFAKKVFKSIEIAQNQAENRQLTRPRAVALAVVINKRDEEFAALKLACDGFFASNGVDPSNLTAD